MSEFDDRWLSLRALADSAARDAGRLPLWRLDAWRAEDPLRILDLGCGSGANLRYLGPRLGGRQVWDLVDQDAALLAALESRHGRGEGSVGWRARVRLHNEDLSLVVARVRRARADLVSASALIDLASARWLHALARACGEARAAVLVALSYDGRIRLAPRDPLDAKVVSLVNRHQRRDKGLGPALGPAAVAVLARRLGVFGYRTWRRRSDWRLDPTQRALSAELLRGWHGAALEVEPSSAGELEGWYRRRCSQLDAAALWLHVGHVDLLALPRSSPRASRTLSPPTV